MVASQFPPRDSERSYVDYMDKHLGIAVENFETSSHEKLLKQGMLCELIFCNSIANEKQSASCADMFLEQTENGTYPMSNWTPGTAQGQGLATHGGGGGGSHPHPQQHSGGTCGVSPSLAICQWIRRRYQRI